MTISYISSIISLISCIPINAEKRHENDVAGVALENDNYLVKIDSMAVFDLIYASKFEEKIIYIGSTSCTACQDFLLVLETVSQNTEEMIHYYNIYLEKDQELAFEVLYSLDAFFLPIILRIKNEEVIDYFLGYDENLENYLLKFLEIK